jgi:predicted NBD/HSP70 family sugar kinase
MKNKHAIGIDVGGTTTKFGIVNNNGEILVQGRIPSNEHDFIEDFIHELYLKISPMINQIGGIENMNDLDISGNPIIKKGSMRWSNIDYSKNRFQFIEDSQKRKIPYIWNEIEQQWVTIQNLHVHSKELVKGLSQNM